MLPPSRRDPEVVRHSASVRWLHWIVAASFLTAGFSGFVVYFPKVLGWGAPLFGGRKGAQHLHPWFALVFTVAFALQFLQWLRRMKWTPADSRFLRHPFQVEPGTGFFNGGQKAYFWAVFASAVVFLATGMVWWYKLSFPHDVYMTCRFIHRVTGLVMAAGLFVHIYKATWGEAGTFRSMITGKVTLEWARLRRPVWHEELTGVPANSSPAADPGRAPPPENRAEGAAPS